MKKLKTAGISILLAACAACLSLAFVACTGGEKNANYGAGEEGFYYYDASDSTRYMLSLQSGTYMITANGDAAYSGNYDYDEETGTVSFTGDAAFSASVGENALSLDMGDSGYSFKAYRYFDVTYVDESGKTVATESVLNGQSAPEIDAEKDGYWFVGWYEDSSNSTEFAFNTSIAGDTTVYGWYIEKNLAATEYEITLDYGDGITETVSTMNGAVYKSLPESHDGKGILGWWVSATNKSEELTRKYDTGDVFASDTTLYAVYGGIGASVTGEGITWVSAGANVSVTVYGEDGSVAISQSSTSSSVSVYVPAGFTALSAGTYTVEVTSGSTTEYLTYVVNGLDRVSASSIDIVVNGDGRVLTFAPVENATRYEITVTDGERTATEDLGSRTYYNISGWDMTKEGLTFTVTAYADGYVPSVSDAYNYLLVLDKVTIEIDGENVVWTRVDNALEYEVIIYGENDAVLESFCTTDTSYSLKYYDAGTYTISVQPVTSGYWSEETKYSGYAKSTLASPVITSITDYSVSWSPVTGAISYVVSVNGNEYSVEEGTTLYFTDSDVSIDTGLSSYEIAVKAVETNGNDSSYSDSVTATNGAFSSAVSYGRNTVSWNYDVSATSYKISVNGDEKYTENGTNSREIELTKVGDNDVVVTAYNGSEAIGQASLTVYAYSVTLDGNGLTTEKTVVYVAQGDTLNLGGVSGEILDHADFMGWYTQADYTEGQSDAYEGKGSLVLDGSTFTGNRNTYLYAYYSYEYVDVTLVTGIGLVEDGEGEMVETTVVSVKYNSTSYVLPVPTPNNPEDAFIGWYSQSNGKGTPYTSADGTFSTAFKGETTLYAYYLAVLFYEKTTYNGQTVYAVSAGSNIDSVTEVTIPAKYIVNGTDYDIILNSDAFFACHELVTINIPDTVLYIAVTNDGYNPGTGAFARCSALEAVNIIATGEAIEPMYFSEDGVLFRKMSLSEEGDVELLYYPYAKTISADEEKGIAAGEYVIPSEVSNEYETDGLSPVTHKVTTIPTRVFRDRQISKVVIANTVTTIETQAFYDNTKLTEIVFAEGGDAELEIADTAFRGCAAVTTVTLPARYTEFNADAFSDCTSLQNVNVESGSASYSSDAGILLNATGDTLIYYPIGRSGEVDTKTLTTNQDRIKTIGANAFVSNTNITSVKISGAVQEIGESAFEGCTGISVLEFEGESNDVDLTIKSRAFYGCYLITEVSLPANLVKIESNAFGGCTNLLYVYFDGKGSDSAGLSFAGDAFGSTPYIQTVEFGTSVPLIDNFASVFDGGRLEEVIVADGNTAYSSDEYGVLYDANKTQIIYYPVARVGSYVVPDTVTKITSSNFSNRTGLTEITIGTGVTEIESDSSGNSAFSACPYLEKINVKTGNTVYTSDDAGILYKILYSDEYAGYDAEGNTTGLEVVYCPLAIKTTSFEFGETVVRTSSRAFYSNTVVSSVKFTGSALDLGTYAFYGCTSLTSVTLPSGMTSISGYAFYNCTGLTSMSIPDTVTTIGEYAFYGCKNLATVNIPTGTTSIGGSAFYDCSSLTTITLPEGLTTIGDSAFRGCSNLTGIEIPSSVTSIGSHAFRSTKITSVTIPEGITALSSYVFYDCSSLTTVSLPSTLTSIGADAFEKCTSLTGDLTRAEGDTTSGIKLPESLQTIGDSAFYNDAKLAVTIPASVTSIGDSAFYGCWNDSSTGVGIVFTAPEETDTNTASLTIGSSAFYNSKYATKVVIPARTTSIGASAFAYFGQLAGSSTIEFEDTSETANVITWGSSSSIFGGSGAQTFRNAETIEEIILPATMTQIPSSMFLSCTALKSVKFGENGGGSAPLTSIGSSAFKNTALESFAIPATVTSIGESAFENTKITQITFPDDSQLTTIDASAFAGTPITSIQIPASVTYVGDHVFENCTELVSVSFQKEGEVSGVTSFDGNTFVNCTSLTTVDLPAGLTSTTKSGDGYAFFDNCPNVKELTLPATLTRIANKGLMGLPGLEKLTFAVDSETGLCSLSEIGEQAFDGCVNLTSIEFADSSASSISMVANVFGGSGVAEVTLPNNDISGIGKVLGDGQYTIKVRENNQYYALSDDGKILYNVGGGTIEYVAGELSGEYTIPTGVTVIGDGAFYGQTGMTAVTIPAAVVKIGGYAFYGCTALTTVTVADGSSMTGDALGEYAFYGCSSLTSINLKEGITEIPNYCFYNCDLSGTTIPSSVTSVGNYAFNGTKIQSINLPNVETIGDYAFQNSSLVTATLGSKLESIGSSRGYAFDGCSGLETVSLAASGVLTSILAYAFQSCTSLSSIEIPGSVTTVGNYVFSGCSSLVTMELPESVTSLGTYVFQNCTSLVSAVLDCNITKCGTSSSTSTKINTFSGCTSLATVVLPDSLEVIGAYFFNGCTSLESIEISDKVTTIGEYAFSGCSSLVNVTFGRKVASMGANAFQNCTSLTYAYTGDSLTSLANYTFSGCTALEAVDFGPALNSIGTSAFNGCTSLAYVEFGNSLTTINQNAFSGCTSLTELLIPSSVSSVGSSAFASCTCVIYTRATVNYVSTTWKSGWDTSFSGTVCYYSQSEPGFNDGGTAYDGYFWHYDEDGEITVWTFAYTTYTTDEGGYVLYSETAGVTYVCMATDGGSAVYAVTECEADTSGYSVTLENGDSYTVVLNETDMTATLTATDAG